MRKKGMQDWRPKMFGWLGGRDDDTRENGLSGEVVHLINSQRHVSSVGCAAEGAVQGFHDTIQLVSGICKTGYGTEEQRLSCSGSRQVGR